MGALKLVCPAWGNDIRMISESEIIQLKELRNALAPLETLVLNLCKANFNILQVGLFHVFLSYITLNTLFEISNFHLTKFVRAPTQIHLSRIIQQNLTNDSAKVYLSPVLQQILLDENLKFLRVYARIPTFMLI